MDGYLTLKQAAVAELVEKRSRFIGAALPVMSESQATDFIAAKRAEYWNASHNCYAYILRGAVQRYSDDGEPQGTAGVPILEVLRKENIVDAAIVVTRYFGGTLLGAGGLVRAYSQTARLAVEAAGRLEKQLCTLFSLELEYPLYAKAGALFQNMGARILSDDFGERVTLQLRIPSADFPMLARAVGEMSCGGAAPVVTGEEFA